MTAGRCRIFYAADIHGSERCFRKWLNAAKAYAADVLIFGGDVAGKILVPIVEDPPGHYAARFHDQELEFDGGAELEGFRDKLRTMGRYHVILTREEKASYDEHPELVAGELFPRVAQETLRSWVVLADERLERINVPAYVMLGNDDYPELDPLFRGEHVINCEEQIVELPGGFEMISFGYSNRTPWDSPRELDEEDLGARIEAMASRLRDPASAVFNFHCPPKDTHIDQAALLDAEFRPRMEGGQIQVGGVGSTAIRALIERYQPVLGLHGHIHESPGAQDVGRSFVLNPGSEYGDGVLRGAIVNLDRKKGVLSWQLIQG